MQKVLSGSNKAQKRIILLGCLLLLIAAWLWWSNVCNSPRNVFWGMLDNSLATHSATRHILSDQGSTKTDQYMQINFGTQNFSRSIVTLSQKSSSGNSTVKTESIGVSNADFSRYNSIQTDRKNSEGQKPNFSNIEGVWGKSSDSASGQYFSQAAFGIVPFVNLNGVQRSQMVKLIRTTNVYSPDFNNVKSQNGNYIFTVELHPFAYLQMLNQLAKISGLHPLNGVNIDDYKNAPAIKIFLEVGKYSHQLTKLTYSSTGQEETYSSYGLNTTIKLPAKTISLEELQLRVVNIQ